MKGRGRGRPKKIVESFNEKPISSSEKIPNIADNLEIVRQPEPLHIQTAPPKLDII